MRCIVCYKSFTYYKEFYERRGFSSQQRCPSCAALRKGRDRRKIHTHIIRAGCVLVDIPASLVQAPTLIKKGEDNPPCFRFVIRSRIHPRESVGYLTVYDHRRSADKSSSLKASIRIMKATEVNMGGSYEYMVLDEPETDEVEGRVIVLEKSGVGFSRKHKGTICVPEGSVWNKCGYSWSDNKYHEWMLVVYAGGR